MIVAARAIVQRRQRLVALGIALLAVLAYGAALGGDYVFDDVHSVSANPALHDLGNLPSFWIDPAAFSVGIGKMYRPALLSTFALNLAISPEAWSCKAGNVLLHALVAVLAFQWIWRLARRVWPAAIAALWFGVHPLASEAINLVSARSELLAGVGLLVGLHAHLSWQRRSSGAWAMFGMVAGTVLACGSKETGVVLPVLCVAQAVCLRHAWPDRAAWRRLLLGLVPVVAVVLGYLIARKLLLGTATVQLLGRVGDDPTSGHGRSLATQLATMGTLLPGVVQQMLLPLRLSFDPVVVFRPSFFAPAVLLGWGALAVLTVLLLWPGPNARLRRLGIVVAWVVALPWIVVPLNMPLAEHRFYGPMLGAALVLASMWPRLQALLRRAIGNRALVAGVAALAVLAIVRSADRSLLYRDERDLWSAELEHNPTSFRSWWGLGTARLRANDVAGSLEPLAKAHALYPVHFDTHRNFAEALVSLPDGIAEPERALAVCAALAASSPRDPWVRTLQVQAELQAGRLRGGRDHFERAEQLALSCLAIAEAKGYVYWLAATARRGLSDAAGALVHLDASIARGLATTSVRLERAVLLRELGRHADARAELLRAQREAPFDPAVMQALQTFAAPGR